MTTTPTPKRLIPPPARPLSRPTHAPRGILTQETLLLATLTILIYLGLTLLTEGNLIYLFTDRALSITASLAIITTAALCAYQAGRLWNTSRTTAILLTVMTLLIGTALTATILLTTAAPDTDHFGSMTSTVFPYRQNAIYITTFFYTTLYLAAIILTTITAHHTTNKQSTLNTQSSTSENE